MTTIMNPLEITNATISKNLKYLFDWFHQEFLEKIHPLFHILRTFDCCHETIKDGETPLVFCVVSFAYFPLKVSSIMLIPKQQYVWQFSESVEYKFTWELGNIDEPIEVLHSNRCSI